MLLISGVDTQQASNPLWTSTALRIKGKVETKTKMLNLEPPTLQQQLVRKLVDIPQTTADISKRLQQAVVKSGSVVRPTQVGGQVGHVTELCTSVS